MSKDWTEDFSRENGNYNNRCTRCGEMFVGHKRRVVCAECINGEVPGGVVSWDDASTENPPDLILSRAPDWHSSCDHCLHQDEGKHYCCLHSMTVKNMDVLRCADWRERE